MVMSTASSYLHKFVVYAPDKTDDGALQRRMSVRAKHLNRSAKLHDAGFLSMCLALVNHGHGRMFYLNLTFVLQKLAGRC